MKDITWIILIYIILGTGYSHVTMHQYHEQTGYPVSYSRMIGPASPLVSSSRVTMNRGVERMTLHPVPTHTTTLWPPSPLNNNIKNTAQHHWHRQYTTTPSPWKIIIPPTTSSHSYNNNHHVTVIHHHIFHRYHKPHNRLITQALITTTLRPPSRTTTTTTTTLPPPSQVTEAVTSTSTSTTTERIAESRSTTSKGVDCSLERERQFEIWRSDDSEENSRSLISSLERNFPSYSDY